MSYIAFIGICKIHPSAPHCRNNTNIMQTQYLNSICNSTARVNQPGCWMPASNECSHSIQFANNRVKVFILSLNKCCNRVEADNHVLTLNTLFLNRERVHLVEISIMFLCPPHSGLSSQLWTNNDDWSRYAKKQYVLFCFVLFCCSMFFFFSFPPICRLSSGTY